MKNSSYEKVHNIRNLANDLFHDVEKLLAEKGITLRQDDGELRQINISIPTSKKNSFVIGLRYEKSDNTFTEDHFLIKKEIETNEKEIQDFYRGKLERQLPEYKGTHKQQIDILRIENGNDSEVYTSVNTICLNNFWSNRGKNEDI